MKSFAEGASKLLISTSRHRGRRRCSAGDVHGYRKCRVFRPGATPPVTRASGEGRRKIILFPLLLAAMPTARHENRLSFFCRNHDGFKIAEKDLSLRGPGEVLGFRQTGWEDLKIADIIRDAGLFMSIQEEIEKTGGLGQDRG